MNKMKPPDLRRVVAENDGRACTENFYINPGDLERLKAEEAITPSPRPPRVEPEPATKPARKTHAGGPQKKLAINLEKRE